MKNKKRKRNYFGRCDYCNKFMVKLPFNCQYCGGTFCTKHRLPEKHDCDGNPKPPPPP